MSLGTIDAEGGFLPYDDCPDCMETLETFEPWFDILTPIGFDLQPQFSNYPDAAARAVELAKYNPGQEFDIVLVSPIATFSSRQVVTVTEY